ncbi:hypothetical protein BLA29_003918 [Euroglyphus maynei]|uniref:Uncharacterized protein n=1 Tax=Euroglyphus maynei TaxID=6958 RepID=A0A1Y3B8Y2_EURMA|nr:hypothetical protein BLA29_003918 [Euroglyphus maynei]
MALTSEAIEDKNSSNKPPERTEAETVSPYGIVHNSPSSARRGMKSQQLQPATKTIGFFGEFVENFFPLQNRTNFMKNQNLNQQQLIDRYLNGYNIHNGKQGRKISKPSRLIQYGNNEDNSSGIGSQLSINKNPLKQNSVSMLMSSPSSSSSLSSSSSSKMLPGFWHEKPVKPSVNLIN